MRKVDEARGEHVRPKRYMTWDEYGRLEAVLVDAVHSRLSQEHERVDMVIGIFRGGLVIARSFASKLGEVPLAIIHTKNGTTARLACLADEDINSIPDERKARMTVLLVDDISDTGRTFQGMKHCLEIMKFRRVFTAALVLKSFTAFVPDCFAQQDETNDWIVFPWEADKCIDNTA